MTKHIYVTGGTGFAGSNSACMIAGDRPNCDVMAYDNLNERAARLVAIFSALGPINLYRFMFRIAGLTDWLGR